MRYEDSTYDEIRNFAIEFITLDRLMYWYPGLEQDEYESIKNLSIAYLEGRIETEIAINEGKSISRAIRITVFARPSLKKGRMRGKIISA